MNDTDPAPTPEQHAAAYAGVRRRVAALVEGADRDAPCPLTPAWTVGDTLAHAVGVADVVAGRIEGAATDPWTAAQVDARLGRTIHDMLAEWDERGPQLEALILQVPTVISGQVVFDVVTHEHDLRYALGAFGAHDSDAIGIAAGWIAGAAQGRKTAMEPAIEVVYGGRRVQWGTGPVGANVTLTEFDFVRTVAGRRSAAQLAALGVARPELLLSAEIFSPAPFDVAEDPPVPA